MPPKLIEFECPGCKAPMQAPPDRIGAKGACAECNTVVEVPRPRSKAKAPRIAKPRRVTPSDDAHEASEDEIEIVAHEKPVGERQSLHMIKLLQNLQDDKTDERCFKAGSNLAFISIFVPVIALASIPLFIAALYRGEVDSGRAAGWLVFATIAPCGSAFVIGMLLLAAAQ